MAIATLNGLLTALSTGSRQQHLQWMKDLVSPASSSYHPHSLFDAWFGGGIFPYGYGPTPATGNGETYDDSSPYAHSIVNPTGDNKLYLASANILNTHTGCMFMLYDRMWANSGFSFNLNTEQSISAVSLPARAADGLGCWLALRTFTQGGTSGSSPAITIKYTNTAGTTGKLTYARYHSTSANRLSATTTIIIPLCVGCTGIKKVESVQLGAVTGTAGDFGLMIFKPLAFVHPSVGGQFSQPALGLLEVAQDACLAWLTTNNSGVPFAADVTLVEG